MRRISRERYNLYTIFVLVAIAQSSFAIDFSVAEGSFISDFNMAIIPIATILVVLVIFVGNDVLRKITIWQKLGVVIIHGIIILIASAFLHALLGFILRYITIGWISLIVKVVLLVLTLIPVFIVLGGLSLKVTDGRFKQHESNE